MKRAVLAALLISLGCERHDYDGQCQDAGRKLGVEARNIMGSCLVRCASGDWVQLGASCCSSRAK